MEAFCLNAGIVTAPEKSRSVTAFTYSGGGESRKSGTTKRKREKKPSTIRKIRAKRASIRTTSGKEMERLQNDKLVVQDGLLGAKLQQHNSGLSMGPKEQWFDHEHKIDKAVEHEASHQHQRKGFAIRRGKI